MLKEKLTISGKVLKKKFNFANPTPSPDPDHVSRGVL